MHKQHHGEVSDELFKKILSNRSLIAHLLPLITDEYKGKPAPPESSIEEMDTERHVWGRLFIRADKLFRVKDDTGGHFLLHFDGQNRLPKYSIFKRMYAFLCLIFLSNPYVTGAHYDQYEKLYSYWIAPAPKADYRFTRTVLIGKGGVYDQRGRHIRALSEKLDMLRGELICLGGTAMVDLNQVKTEPMRVFSILLTPTLSSDEKARILLDEYGYDYQADKEFGKEVDDMVDLISAYKREIREETRAEFKKAFRKQVRETVRKQVAEAVATSKAKAIAQGRAQGMAQGRAQGMAQGRAQGMAQGRAQGMAQGRAQGMTQGMAKGRADERMSIIAKLRQQGVSEAIIQSL